MSGKKILLPVVVTFMFLISFIPYAFASTLVAAIGNFSHSSWSPDWGTKNFKYTLTYEGDAFSGYEVGSVYKAVNNHDFDAYKTPADVIYPPEVGNGNSQIYRVEMVDSNGNIDDYLAASSFEDGTIRGYIVPGGTYFYFVKKSYGWLQIFASDSYYLNAKTYFELDSTSWFPSGPWIDTASTQTF